MSLTFNGTDAALEWVKGAGTMPRTALPVSYCVWVKSIYTGTDQWAVAEQSAAGDTALSLWLASNGTSMYAVHQNSGIGSSAANGVSAGTLKLACVNFASTTSRGFCYGSNSFVTDTGTRTDDVNTHDRVLVGARRISVLREFWKGDIAELHFFNRALVAADYDAMSTGTLPESVSGWIDGWTLKDLASGLVSLGGTRTLTAYGTVTNTGTHPYSRSTPDTTPPVLSIPTGISTGSTTATVGATTDEGNGTLYAVVTTSATAPTKAQIKAGQSAAGSAANWSGSLSVSSTGAKTIGATGLTGATTYYAHLMHEDAAGNQSNVVSSASFTTAAVDATPPTLTGSITVDAVTSTSIQISWPAGSDNVAVTSYETSPDGTTWTDRGNVLTYTFTGLTPSTSYTLRVRAKDAAGNVSTPALSVTQATSAPTYPTLTSSPLKSKAAVLHLSAPFEAFIHNPTTGALILRATGLTSHPSTGVVTVSDVALASGTQYRVVWRRTDTGALGVELLTAS